MIAYETLAHVDGMLSTLLRIASPSLLCVLHYRTVQSLHFTSKKSTCNCRQCIGVTLYAATISSGYCLLLGDP